MMNRRIFSVAAAAMSLQPMAQAATVNYPDRPITMIVPFAAGNVTDMTARLIAEHLSKSLNQPVVVDNKPGASGGVGMTAISRANPDGYTIGFSSIGPLALTPALYSKIPYNPEDYSIIGVVYSGSYLALVRADSPYQTLDDIVKASLKSDKGLDFASPGNGSLQHLSGELFSSASGAKLVHVPNKSSGQATSLLMGGHVPLLFEVPSVALPLVQSGQLRALGISSSERLPALPSTPTFEEAGYPKLVIEGWLCLVTSAKVDEQIKQRLSTELQKIMANPDVKARILNSGAAPVSMSMQDSERYVRSERSRWSSVIKNTGIKLD